MTSGAQCITTIRDPQRSKNFNTLRSMTRRLGLAIKMEKETGKKCVVLNTLTTILDLSNIFAEIIDKNGRLIYLSPASKKIITEHTGKEPVDNGENYCFIENNNRSKPCDNCIAFKSLSEKTALMEEGIFYGEKLRMTAVPIFDNGTSAVIMFAERIDYD